MTAASARGALDKAGAYAVQGEGAMFIDYNPHLRLLGQYVASLMRRTCPTK